MERQLLGEFSFTDPEDLSQVTHLYASGVSYPGLMRQLQEFIEAKGHECELRFAEMPERKYDWRLKWGFRALQEPAAQTAFDDIVSTIQAPPGCGKTIIASAQIAWGGVDTIIVAPNERPFEQIYQTLKEATTVDVGRYGNGYKQIKPCTVVILASLASAMKNDPQGELMRAVHRCRMFICDETHKLGASTGLGVFEQLKNVVWITGYSATPERIDYRQSLLEAMIGLPRHTITRAQALDNGLSVPLSIYIEDVPPQDFGFLGDRGFSGKNLAQKARQFQKVYKEYIVRNEVRNQGGLNFANTLTDVKLSCALICKEIEHIEAFCDMDKDVVALHGQMKKKDKEDIFEALKRKDILKVATTLMDEAVDVPSLSGVCLMAGGKSYIKTEQRLRCDRKFNGETSLGWFDKDRGFVYYPKDHADGLTTHSQTVIKQFKSIVSEHRKHRLLYL